MLERQIKRDRSRGARRAAAIEEVYLAKRLLEPRT